MRRLFIFGLCALMLGLLFTQHASAEVPKGFFTSLSAVKAAAQQQHKLIYLHFTTTWCGWCRKIESDTYPKPAAQEALKDFVSASLDCTVERGKQPTGETKINADLFEKCGGTGYPYLVMLSEDGKVVLHTVGGYVPVDQFVQELKAAKTANKEYQDFLAYAANADQQSLDFAVRAMQTYVKFKQFDKATEMARLVLKLDQKDEKGKGAEANWILLQALPVNDQIGAKGAELLKEIQRLDPVNEKGSLEQAMMSTAMTTANSSNPNDTVKFQAALKQSEQILLDLTGKAKTLKDGQYTYAILGIIQNMRGETDAALATLEKAIAIDPQSQMAGQLKQKIAEIKGKAKEK